LHAIESVDAVALVVDDISALIDAATLSVVDRVELVLGKVLKD